MTDDASLEAAGEGAGSLPPAASKARPSIFDLREVAPLTPDEQQAKDDAMARALAFGAEPLRDQRGRVLEVDFIAANGEAVAPWRHDPRHKRLYRRSRKLAKVAGQLVGQPGDREELAKRFAVLHHREGADIDGAVRRGLFDAIWRLEHVYDSFTVPRRSGRHHIKTGRIAAVAEDRRRRWQAEGLAPADAFWVRNRRNTGLVLVTPKPDPQAHADAAFNSEIDTGSHLSDSIAEGVVGPSTQANGIFSAQGDVTLVGQGPEEPELPGNRDIVTFLEANKALAAEEFRQRAFEAGLDPDRAIFFRDLLIITPETRLGLKDRSRSLFTGDERIGGIDLLIDNIARSDDPEVRRNLIQSLARHARPLDPNEDLALGVVSPVGRVGRRRRNRRSSDLSRRFVLPRQERDINWNRELRAPQRREFPDTGTTLYSVPNQPVAEWVIRHGRPLGFKTGEAFKAFVDRLHGTVTNLDIKARVAIRGSAVNGLRFDTKNQEFSKTFFDMKIDEASDFDIAIVSPALLRRAGAAGIPVLRRNGGLRTPALDRQRALDELGLLELWRDIEAMSEGREFSFMIYESVEQLERLGTMMLLR